MNKNSTLKTYNNDEMLLDDYPEFTQADIDRAIFKVAGQTVDKATWQQNVKKSLKKQRISINLDLDVLDYFKAQAGGRGYQTLINQTLRQVMMSQ